MMRILSATLVLLTLAAALAAQETLDAPTAVLVAEFRSKTSTPETRAQAATQLIRVREAICGELTAWLDRTRTETRATRQRVAVMGLLGFMGYLPARPALEAELEIEKSLKPDPAKMTLGERLALSEHTRMNGPDSPATNALDLIGLPAQMTGTKSVPRADLSQFGDLQKAVQALEGGPLPDAMLGNQVLYGWYSNVTASLDDLVRPHSPLAADVPVLAAHVLGEFRSLENSYLQRWIDLRDDSDLAAALPQSITVRTDDAQYPCVVALLKCGSRRAPAKYLIGCVSSEESAEARERLVRTALLIDADGAKEAFAERLASLDSTDVDPKRAPVARERLNSVKAMLD